MFQVFVRGLELHAHHGVQEEERRVGHMLSVDVDLDVEGDAPETDRLDGTCDYAAVCRVVRESLLGESRRTVERAAAVTLERILEEFPSVVHAKISVAKLRPAIPESAREVGATLARRRHTW